MKVLYIIIFTLLFNWSVNLQIASQLEKDKNTRLISIVLSFAIALGMSILLYVTT